MARPGFIDEKGTPLLSEVLAQAAERGFGEDEAALQKIRQRYFEKYVAGNKNYLGAPPAQQAEIEMHVLGGTKAPASPTPSLPPASPTPEAGMPQPMQPASGMPGRIGRGLLDAAQGQMKPGGLLSPEAQGTAGGALIGGALGGPAAPVTALIGAGAGGMLGRGYEMLTGDGAADAGDAVTQMGQASQRGMMSEAMGQGAGAMLSRIGNRIAQPMGELSQDAARTMSQLDELGMPMRAGSIHESRGLTRAEELPQGFMFGSGPGARFDAAKANRQREIVMEMADEWSPGVKRDWQDVGRSLADKAEKTKRMHLATASDLYERSKDIVGRDSKFAITNLAEAAQGVVAAEAPMQSLAKGTLRTARPFSSGDAASPVAQALAEAGYQPDKIYSFEELLGLNQRLGSAIRRAPDRATKRELSTMWAAAQQDLMEAAETAGAPEAIEMVRRGNEYYRTFIVPVFDDSSTLKALAKKPSLAAKIIASPKTSVEEMRKAHVATAGPAWDELRGKWYEGMVEKATRNGEFDAPSFVRQVRAFDQEKLAVLAGAQRKKLNTLVELLERENRTSSTSNRASLAMGQVIGALRAVQNPSMSDIALQATGVPILLGSILNHPKGIQWLTVGLKNPETMKGKIALASLMGIAKTTTTALPLALTRPGGLGQLGFAPLPQPGPTPGPVGAAPAMSATPGPGLPAGLLGGP